MTPDGGTFWLPRQGSELAASVDRSWNLVFGVASFFFLLVLALMVLFVWRYRGGPERGARSTTDHSTALEVLWSVIPTLIVVGLFWSGYSTFLKMVTPPAEAYRVQVTGQKWNWLFTYPNGYVDSELHVPLNTPVRLVMTSQDVIHALYVPAFRIKRDVMPGRYSQLWFTPVVEGQFDLFCAEYCGKDHSHMLSRVHVEPREKFDAWLAQASDFLTRMPPAEAGQMLYQVRGCKQCHSVDGSAGTGPTFRALWGSRVRLATGESVSVDENYVRQSIVDPQSQVVAGFEPVMPTYQGRLKDDEISAVIAYLETLR